MKNTVTRVLGGSHPMPILTVASALAMASLFATFSPPIALAQSATSPIANTTLPGGGARLNSGFLRQSVGGFLRDLASEQKLAPGSERDADLFWWKGASYKPGRVNFWRSSYRKALETAGYRYREFGGREITTNIYKSQYGMATFDGDDRPDRSISVGMGDSQNYFVAAHPQTGVTFIGMWLDQDQAKQCVLAIEQVGSAAPVKMVALAAVAGGNAQLVKDPNNVMKGVAPPKNPTFGALSAKPRMARGLVKTMAGKPIAGATISLQSSAAGGLRTSVTTKTNAQGLYEVPLPMGVCQVVDAYCRLMYNGKPLYLPLHVVDGELDYFNSSKGHVENFVLRTWGAADADQVAQTPESGTYYYGGSIRIQWFLDGLPETGTVEVTLKPSGPLVDGTVGRTFVMRYPTKGDEIINVDHYINNIPLGRYTMTVRLLDGADAMPMRIEKVYGKSELSEKMTIDFKSSGTGYATLGRSGVEQFSVLFKP